MKENSAKTKSKIFGYAFAIAAHIVLISLLFLVGHNKSNEDFEEMIPVAVTVFDEPAEATGEMVTQEVEENTPEPEQTLAPEPDPPQETVAIIPEKPEPEIKKEEPKKEEPPKKTEAKKEEPKKKSMADRIAEAKKNTQKDNTPKPPKPKTVTGSDIYKAQQASGKAAIKGTIATDGLSSDQANAQQLYFSVINTDISRRWNRIGPNELGVIPSPVVVMFDISSLGVVSNFKIVQRSSSAAMNTAAESLGAELRQSRFKSYAETGIKGLGSSPMKNVRMELRYLNK